MYMQGYDIKTRTLQSTLKFHINLHCVINLHYNKVIVIKTVLDTQWCCYVRIYIVHNNMGNTKDIYSKRDIT